MKTCIIFSDLQTITLTQIYICTAGNTFTEHSIRSERTWKVTVSVCLSFFFLMFNVVSCSKLSIVMSFPDYFLPKVHRWQFYWSFCHGFLSMPLFLGKCKLRHLSPQVQPVVLQKQHSLPFTGPVIFCGFFTALPIVIVPLLKQKKRKIENAVTRHYSLYL